MSKATKSERVVSAAADLYEAASAWSHAAFMHGLNADAHPFPGDQQGAAIDALNALLREAGVDQYDLLREKMRREAAAKRAS